VGGNDHFRRPALPAPAAHRGTEILALRPERRAPRLFGIEPPRARVEAVRTVDMSGSNAWAEFANLYRLTRAAALDHDRAKAELKAFVPEDAKEASGHGVRAKRSRSGAISFELVETEIGHAAL
jgi:hypothetical protein